MSSHNAEERRQLDELVKNYRRTWSSYMEAVDALRRTMDDEASGTEACAGMRATVDSTAEEYREARNQLAGWLLTFSKPEEPIRISAFSEEALCTSCGR